METLTYPIIMAVAIWGGFAQLLRAYELLNRERDRIILGKIDDQEIDIDHQRLIMNNDWTPLSLGLIMYLVTFSGIILSLPSFAPHKNLPQLWWLCSIMCICPFFAACAFFIGWIRDRKKLTAIIETRVNVRTVSSEIGSCNVE